MFGILKSNIWTFFKKSIKKYRQAARNDFYTSNTNSSEVPQAFGFGITLIVLPIMCILAIFYPNVGTLSAILSSYGGFFIMFLFPPVIHL